MKIKVIVLVILLVAFFSPKGRGDFLHEKLKLPSKEFNYIVCTHENLPFEKPGGVGQINFYNAGNKKANINFLEVVSESLEVQSEFNSSFLTDNNLNVVYKEFFDNFTLYYCYSKTLEKKLLLNNTFFNLQIAIYESSFKVGYPAILDGF